MLIRKLLRSVRQLEETDNYTVRSLPPPRPRDLSFQAFRSFLTRSLKHSRFFTGVLLPLCQLGPLQVLSSLLPRGRSRQRTAVLGGEGGQSRRSPEPSPCPHRRSPPSLPASGIDPNPSAPSRPGPRQRQSTPSEAGVTSCPPELPVAGCAPRHRPGLAGHSLRSGLRVSSSAATPLTAGTWGRLSLLVLPRSTCHASMRCHE